jgi:hypothetical protein
MLRKLLTAALLLSLTTFAPAATTGCSMFAGPCSERGHWCTIGQSCCSGLTCVLRDEGNYCRED